MSKTTFSLFIRLLVIQRALAITESLNAKRGGRGRIPASTAAIPLSQTLSGDLVEFRIFRTCRCISIYARSEDEYFLTARKQAFLG